MTEKQMKNYVINLYKYKKIRDYQFKNAISNLEKIRDSDLFFYYFNMGKLHTAFGNVKKAICYLEKSIMLKPEYSSAYYNLYKCYVRLNDMKKAQSNFEKFLEVNNKNVNFELVINIMNAINVIDKDFFEYLSEDFSVEYTSKCGYNKLDNNIELKDIYLEVLKSFNAREYLACIKKLELMNSKINQIAYPMEVDTLIEIIKYLKNKEIIHYRKYLEEHKEISNETSEVILYRLYKLGYYSIESFFRKIEEIILNDSLIKGNIILDKISSDKDFENHQDIIEYLKGIIREKEAFELLGEDKQKEFTKKRLIAKKQYITKQTDICLNSYLELKEEYNLPICDYYIGKIMFRKGDFLKAREYFLSYLEYGGVKTEKAYIFLTKIENVKKNKSVVKKYIKILCKINKIFLREFEYLSDYQYKMKKKQNINNNNDDSIDVVKNNRMKTIRMKEDDFKEVESLSISDFYDVNIDGKLAIVRNLLRCRNVKSAQKLLEEIERECTPQDHSKIKQFQKNRKIYMNQIRNN